jgi:hypothetical protein
VETPGGDGQVNVRGLVLVDPLEQAKGRDVQLAGRHREIPVREMGHSATQKALVEIEVRRGQSGAGGQKGRHQQQQQFSQDLSSSPGARRGGSADEQ